MVRPAPGPAGWPLRAASLDLVTIKTPRLLNLTHTRFCVTAPMFAKLLVFVLVVPAVVLPPWFGGELGLRLGRNDL